MEDDRLLTGEPLGKYLGGKSRRSVRRFLSACPIPTYLINGRKHVRKRELDAWLDSQKIEPAERKQDLKSLLVSISNRVLAERQRNA